MKSKIFTCLCILLFVEAHAQSSSTANASRVSRNDWSSILRGNQPLVTKKATDIEMRGHPFTSDEWYDGSVILNDSSRSEDPKLKFKLNVEESEIWVLLPDKTERILTDVRIVGLELKRKDSIIAYRKFLLPESPTIPRFVQIIYGGAHYSMIKYIKKTFVKADYVDKGVAVIGRKYDSFDAVESYFVVAPDKKMSKIKLSKGDILKATATVSRLKREEILEYCKENDIRNPINEEDAALMLAYIDKLH